MTVITRGNFKEIFPEATMTWAGLVNVQTSVKMGVYREMYVDGTYNRKRYMYPQDIIDLLENRIIKTRHLNSQKAYLPKWEQMIKLCEEIKDES